MNLRQIKVLAKLKTMIYSATTIEPTSANIQSIDSDVTLEINGDFMSMVIKYTGIIDLHSDRSYHAPRYLKSPNTRTAPHTSEPIFP